MNVLNMAPGTIDTFTFSNLCRILGRLEGIAYGVEDEKTKTALLKITKDLFGLLYEKDGGAE